MIAQLIEEKFGINLMNVLYIKSNSKISHIVKIIKTFYFTYKNLLLWYDNEQKLYINNDQKGIIFNEVIPLSKLRYFNVDIIACIINLISASRICHAKILSS